MLKLLRQADRVKSQEMAEICNRSTADHPYHDPLDGPDVHFQSCVRIYRFTQSCFKSYDKHGSEYRLQE